LARFAGARLVADEAVGIDRSERRLLFRNRPPLRYDVLSLDIGSTPNLAVPGAAAYATPVKPIAAFERRWRRLVERAREAERPLRIVVVGGGAGGVELTLAMQHRLQGMLGSLGRPVPVFALVTGGGLLPSHNAGVRRAMRRIVDRRGIVLHTEAEVVGVERDGLCCADGRRIGFDELLWVTEAGAAPWLRDTGLALDQDGFVAVDATLRSVNDPRVFAAGDVAGVIPHPREKAGVFAVRQGPPLADNLRRALAGERLRPFVPQRRFLSLISTGDRYAIGSRGRLTVEGSWVWRWKDWIDRRWMRGYQELPPMRAAPPAQAGQEPMRCGGCGAKVPAAALARVLRRLAPSAGAEVEVGVGDDAAVLQFPTDRLMLQTADFFRSFVSDPYLFGRVAANHALGDIYAMGGAPLSALAIAAVPPGPEAIVEDDLFQMLSGGLATLDAAGARLVGGHSAEAGELALGFAVTGTVLPQRVLRKEGLRPGDRLILTKPLGTGVLLAAEMRGAAKARWIAEALATMLQPAADAASCLVAHGATACTDVTGFGLVGHLLEMLQASRVDAVLAIDEIPALEGAREMLGAGIASTLHPSNLAHGRAAIAAGPDAPPAEPLLFDPQTAGGLLAGVPAERTDSCLEALHRLGYGRAAVVGAVEASQDRTPRIRLSVRLPEPARASLAFGK
jgi:selenide,water dikinase